jgi:hypothetical protein
VMTSEALSLPPSPRHPLRPAHRPVQEGAASLAEVVVAEVVVAGKPNSC